MSDVSIEVFGIQECQDYFTNAAESLVENVSLKLADVCQQIAEYAQSIAPVRTGAYRDSIHVEQNGPLDFSIVADASYAAFIEFGTAPHIIIPSQAKVLAFDVGGETVFAKYVMHPGTPAFMTIHTAKKDNMANIVDAIRQGVAEALSEGVSK